MCAAPGRWRRAARQVREMREFFGELTLLVRDLTLLVEESHELLVAVVLLATYVRTLF